MNSATLILGIIPLIVFVLVDSFSSTKMALIFAVLFALAETIFSLYYFQTIDEVTIFSFVMVLILGAISYKNENPLWFKFQPVILSVFIGAYLIITFLINKPLLVEMTTKYISLFPIEKRSQIMHPYFQALLGMSTLTVGISFLLHGVLVAICAVKLSNIWWLIMRGVGFYLFMFLGLFVAKLLI